MKPADPEGGEEPALVLSVSAKQAMTGWSGGQMRPKAAESCQVSLLLLQDFNWLAFVKGKAAPLYLDSIV